MWIIPRKFEKGQGSPRMIGKVRKIKNFVNNREKLEILKNPMNTDTIRRISRSSKKSEEIE